MKRPKRRRPPESFLSLFSTLVFKLTEHHHHRHHHHQDQTNPRNKDKCNSDTTAEDVRTECWMKVIIIPNETQPRSLLTHTTSSTSHSDTGGVRVTYCNELVVIASLLCNISDNSIKKRSNAYNYCFHKILRNYLKSFELNLLKWFYGSGFDRRREWTWNKIDKGQGLCTYSEVVAEMPWKDNFSEEKKLKDIIQYCLLKFAKQQYMNNAKSTRIQYI